MSHARRRLIACGALLTIAFASGVARADGPEDTPPETLKKERYELAGFPIIGGNSDIGVQFGGAATLTRFQGDARPYFWNADLLLSASVKDDANGTRLIQQSHVLRLDVPQIFGNAARLDARLSFKRTINEGYFGIGNASSADVPAGGGGDPGRQFQWLNEEARARAISRIHTGTLIDIALGVDLRFDSPESYAGSKLAVDAMARNGDGSPYIRGTDTLFMGGLAGGIIIDTRDSEFVTTRGMYYQLGVLGTAGTADGILYGQAAAVLAHYAKIGGPVLFASRFVASFDFGNVPFYDLQNGGVFESQSLFGGETGVRGVPDGRYAGLVKVVSNTEIRIPFPRFTFLKQRLRVGSTTFFDAGRVWSGYTENVPLDGTKLNLKYGIGGGFFLQWGEAAIFRVEVAYSPDAVAENPGFPFGIYVADGLMF